MLSPGPALRSPFDKQMDVFLSGEALRAWEILSPLASEQL